MTMSKIEWKKSKINYDELNKLNTQKLARIDSINQNRTTESCSKGGKIGGPIGGAKSRDEKTGFHAMSKEERRLVSSKAGKISGPISGNLPETIKRLKSMAKSAGLTSVKSPNHVNNKRLTCPHCGKEGGYTAMKRHHMDRCKHKK